MNAHTTFTTFTEDQIAFIKGLINDAAQKALALSAVMTREDQRILILANDLDATTPRGKA